MKINEVLGTKLPFYHKQIVSWDMWVQIRDSGKWDPHQVNNYVQFFNEGLTSLIGSPRIINGNFNCEQNKLETLKGGPEIINGDMECSFNKLLTTLDGAPKKIAGEFECYSCNLTSLKNIQKNIIECNKLALKRNPITSNILGLLLIRKLSTVTGDHQAFDIINNHLKLNKDVLECQEELISAGLKEFAKL